MALMDIFKKKEKLPPAGPVMPPGMPPGLLLHPDVNDENACAGTP